MDDTHYITINGLIAALCWLLVATAAGLAVFSERVPDTLLERVGLSCISITAVATAYRCLVYGWETPGDMALAVSAAIYSSAIIYKHWRSRHPRPL